MFETKIVRKITELDKDQWTGIFPGIENYDFLKTLDESAFPEFSFYYILILKGSEPIGAASCFVMDFALDMATEGPIKNVTTSIRKFFPRFLKPKIAVCGIPMGQGRLGISPEELPQEVVNLIYKALEDIAKKEEANIVAFKDFNNNYRFLLDTCLDKSFLRIDSLPTTMMSLSYATYEEYLKSLSSVSRSGIKRKFKEIDGKIDIQLEIKNKLSQDEVKEVHTLYLQTFDQHDLSIEKLTPEFFEGISNNMPDETRYFLWRLDGKIVAYALCLVKGDYFIDYYLGFDYSISRQYHLFDVRFRDLIKWCIDHGIKTYEMGQTVYEPKRRLGFDFVPLNIYVKHRNKIFNPFFKMICHLVKPSNFDPVFKELKKNGKHT